MLNESRLVKWKLKLVGIVGESQNAAACYHLVTVYDLPNVTEVRLGEHQTNIAANVW